MTKIMPEKKRVNVLKMAKEALKASQEDKP